MKKTILLFVASAALFFVTTVQAQKNGQKFSGGFGIESGLMTGHPDFKKNFTSQFGISARFALLAGPGYITFTSGGSLIIPRAIGQNNFKVGTHVPFKFGYKYITGKFFIMGETGYSLYNIYKATGPTESEGKLTTPDGFTFAPAVGLNLGILEIGLRYEITRPVREDKTISMLGLRAGLNF